MSKRKAERLIRRALAEAGYPIIKGESAESALRAAIEFEVIRAAHVNAILDRLQAQIAENGDQLRSMAMPDFTEQAAALIGEAEALIIEAAYDAR
jgi:hypothetical protein